MENTTIKWEDIKNDPNAIKVLDHGFVYLKSTYGTDTTICEAARMSYGDGTRSQSDSRALIRYLQRHKHSGPTEQVSATFLLKLPLFVMAQLVRHRTAKLNQLSGRYSEMPEEYYLPDVDKWRKQSATNKQGGEELMEYDSTCYRSYSNDNAGDFEDCIDTFIEEGNGVSGEDIHKAADVLLKYRDENPKINAENAAREEYQNRLKAGMSRELARTCLPQSQYTVCVWQMDLHNLTHFLELRLSSHAQYEIRVYAQAIYDLLRPKFPITLEAFEDYKLHAKTFSRMELQVLKKMLSSNWFTPQIQHDCEESSMSKREIDEFVQKLSR